MYFLHKKTFAQPYYQELGSDGVPRWQKYLDYARLKAVSEPATWRINLRPRSSLSVRSSPRRYPPADWHGAAPQASAPTCSSQNLMSISRYIAAAAVRCSRAWSRLPERR